MNLSSGSPETVIGLLDGPVAMDHPDLAGENIQQLAGRMGRCSQPSSAACTHGTFVAGILCARRGSPAPAICPGCTLQLRLIFKEMASSNGHLPSAAPAELGAAIVESVDGGARLLN